MAQVTVKTGLELYLRQIDQSPLLTAEQERELCWKIIHENCPRARETMVRSNLRLVVNLAKRYGNRGLSLPDLIEEGNLGLLRAVEAFDPDQGARFSTYASWWIKQSIKRALINAVQPIHIPAYMVELIAQWKRASAQLQEKLGRQPSIQELAEAMQLPPRKVRIIRKAVRAFQRPAQNAQSREDGPTLNEMLHDPRTAPPDEQALKRDDLKTIRRLLDTIDQREATILRLRFGLDGREPLTLKQIGQEIGLTRERVRQIEIEALAKLNALLSTRKPLTPRHGAEANVDAPREPVASGAESAGRGSRRRGRSANSSSAILDDLDVITPEPPAAAPTVDTLMLESIPTDSGNPADSSMIAAAINIDPPASDDRAA